MENNENYEKNLEDFEKKINYTFKDKNLLFVALSHSSFANEKRKLRHSNERLEFLGDSVLSIVVSQYLFEHFTHLPEGELTKIRASLVCEKSLYEFAKEILRLAGKEEQLNPVPTPQSDLSSARPAYAVLDNFILRIIDVYEMPGWKDSLEEFMKEKREG